MIQLIQLADGEARNFNLRKSGCGLKNFAARFARSPAIIQQPVTPLIKLSMRRKRESAVLVSVCKTIIVERTHLV